MIVKKKFEELNKIEVKKYKILFEHRNDDNDDDVVEVIKKEQVELEVNDSLNYSNNMSLMDLECYQMICEIWSYLSIKDIGRMLRVSKNIYAMSLRMNILVSKDININKKWRVQHMTKYEKDELLTRVITSFPNISKLNMLDCRSLFEINEHRSHFEINELSTLYNNESIGRSLKELKVIVKGEKALEDISNLRNLTTLYLEAVKGKVLFSGHREYAMITNVLKNLCGLSSLQSLSLTNFNRTNEYFHLSNLINLTSLFLIRCDLDESINGSLSFLSALTNIQVVSLHCCELSNNTLFFVSSIVNLTSLSIQRK